MISLNGKRIVLIGGAGFIGHHLALGLKREGAEVSIVDSLQINNLLSFYSTGEEMPNRRLYLQIINERLRLLQEADIPLHVLDAREYHPLTHLMRRIEPQVIVQLAAVSHAGRSNKDPYSTFDHSLRTLENALDNARGRVEHFIFFSSSMVYGNFNSDSVTEESPCEPIGIYGALKFAGEKLTIAYNQAFDLPYTIVRPSALYGERCVSRRVGQIFIENASRGLDVIVNGDGTDRLDFTYIGDLVQGIVKVLQSESSKGQIFNLTYGESSAINDMAEILRGRFPNLNIEYQPRDKLTPRRGTLCVDKARELLGYAPQYPLEKGFLQYMDWYQSIWAEYGEANS